MRTTERTRERIRLADELYAAGRPYSEIADTLQVSPRRARSLLAAAGVFRPVGRPRTRPQGDRVGLEFAGVL